MRAKTLAAFNLFVSASLVFNQYVNPVALQKMGWKYYIVYLAWLAFELVFMYFFCVESESPSSTPFTSSPFPFEHLTDAPPLFIPFQPRTGRSKRPRRCSMETTLSSRCDRPDSRARPGWSMLLDLQRLMPRRRTARSGLSTLSMSRTSSLVDRACSVLGSVGRDGVDLCVCVASGCCLICIPRLVTSLFSPF